MILKHQKTYFSTLKLSILNL